MPVGRAIELPHVLYWGDHADDEYWDRGLLSDVLAGTAWRVPGSPSFTNMHGARLPDGRGGVMVVAARQNVEHVAELEREMTRMAWCLVALTGDEEDAFPWRDVTHDGVRVWKMGGQVAAMDGCAQPLGSGYPPWFRACLPNTAPDKPLDWYFAGQLNHARRDDMAAAFRDQPNGLLLPSPGFTQGRAHGDYAHGLASAKVAPCPSGLHTPDTFRLYEALEAGCIPLADGATPGGRADDYWTYIFGGPPPFPVVGEWEHAPATMREILDGWPANANRVGAWWQQWKRDLAYRFHDQLADLRGEPRTMDRPADEITVVMPTSPAGLHPSTAHIEETIESIRASLGDCEIVVCADGVRPEQEHLRDAYDEYLRRLVWLTNHRWHNVVPVLMDTWGHQANVARHALTQVRTPLVLFVEHDTPLVGDIDWSALCAAMHTGRANVIRLHHETHVLEPHRHLMLDREPRVIAGAPMLRTEQWSQRPHLARTLWYRQLIDRVFPESSRSMIEDRVYGIVENACRDHGVTGWEEWRLWLYAPDGSIKRSTHLDSRGDGDKYDMRFT